MTLQTNESVRSEKEQPRADLVAIEVGDFASLTRRRSSGHKAHTALLDAVRHLLLEHLATQHAPVLAAVLADGPRQARLDGRQVLLQVVAVQAQPRLQTQRVARTQPTQTVLLICHQRLRQRQCILVGHLRVWLTVHPAAVGAPQSLACPSASYDLLSVSFV
jgi:hypothetical protein